MGNFQKMSGQPHTNAGGVKTLPESVRQMELRTCFYVRVFKPLRAATADVLDPSGHKSKSAALMLAAQKDTLFDPLGKVVYHVVNGVRKIAKNHYHSCQKDPQKKQRLSRAHGLEPYCHHRILRFLLDRIGWTIVDLNQLEIESPGGTFLLTDFSN
jgi:hypothetical protein